VAPVEVVTLLAKWLDRYQFISHAYAYLGTLTCYNQGGDQLNPINLSRLLSELAA
jgi:hypothetical protein